jgi:hypothetical protein
MINQGLKELEYEREGSKWVYTKWEMIRIHGFPRDEFFYFVIDLWLYEFRLVINSWDLYELCFFQILFLNKMDAEPIRLTRLDMPRLTLPSAAFGS